MFNRTKRAVPAVLAGALSMLVLLAAAGLLIVYTGAYNVAATEDHMSFTRWAFDTTFRQSVERRAAGLPAPEQPSAATVASGASTYKATCQHCHGGPGAERAGWAAGMRPRPPHLAEAAAQWSVGEIFWIAKHGVTMTGMPAFGPSHDDRTLWSVAAFVRELPAMTPERYAALGEAAHEASGSVRASAPAPGTPR